MGIARHIANHAEQPPNSPLKAPKLRHFSAIVRGKKHGASMPTNNTLFNHFYHSVRSLILKEIETLPARHRQPWVVAEEMLNESQVFSVTDQWRRKIMNKSLTYVVPVPKPSEVYQIKQCWHFLCQKGRINSSTPGTWQHNECGNLG